MKTERRGFIKGLIASIIGFFVVDVDAVPKPNKARPKPIILTFYQPSRLFVATYSPNTPPNPKDKTKYWMNSITGQFFKFEDGRWTRLPENPGMEVSIGEEVGTPLKFSDPDGPCDESAPNIRIVPSPGAKPQMVHIEDPGEAVKDWVRSLPSLQEIENGVWDQGKKVMDFPPSASTWTIGPKA